MIPPYMMQIEKMPITSTGKLDKRALPEIEVSTETTYIAPRNEVEESLCQLFYEILGVEKIGVQDNFFELGGHSLRAMRLVNRIEAETGKKILLKEMMEQPTIEKLATLITGKKAEVYTPIPIGSEKASYPMSSTQKRMYLLNQIDANNVTYNIPQGLKLTGQVDLKRLKSALEVLMGRHEILRTTFATVNDELTQQIHQTLPLEFCVVADNQTSEKQLFKAFIQPFDLASGPLLRVKVVERETGDLLLIDMHHIISDGMSVNILTNELMSLYHGNDLAPLTHQYKDYSEWMEKRELEEQKAYWLDQFKEEAPILDMPLDYPRPSEQSFKGEIIFESIETELTQQIKTFAKERQLTEYMVFLSAMMILLSKYSRQEDIVIGSPVSGRTHTDTENMLGMFVNTLAMRGRPIGAKSYESFLAEIKETCLKAYEHQEYPFESLIEEVVSHRDMSRNPLFDMMLVMQNNEYTALQLDGMKLEPIEIDFIASKFDLTCSIYETDEGYQLALEYCTDLYKEESIRKLSQHLSTILNQVINCPTMSLNNIETATEQERAVILTEFNQTTVEYQKDTTVIQLFEEQVAKTPDQVAVVFEGEHLTYQELNIKANALAHQLRKLGVRPDDYVAMLTERSPQMMIGIVGILKAGGAYVPLDLAAPQERINYVLKDCQPKAVLTTQAEIKIEIDLPLINLTEEGHFNWDAKNPVHINEPSDLMYLIYTSGTTGRPKGVMVEHRNALNLIDWYRICAKYTESTVILQSLNYIFDASVEEIFPALLSGCTLEIMSENDKKDPEKILNAFKNKQFATTPSLFNVLLNYAQAHGLTKKLHSFEKLYMGGESIPKDVLETYRNMDGSKIQDIFNLYGPTEATVTAACYQFKQHEDSVLIGQPINNVQIYILSDNQLCGIGIPGELCIAGDGVTRGYLNHPELTKEKFIPNPYGEGRLYLTGDLARWRSDGNIEYLGRVDNQVKIRGFRIELGEIESNLRKIEGVTDATVLVKEDASEQQATHAYYVAKEQLDIEQIKEELHRTLPEYMIPTYMQQIEKIPVTPNGKVDKKALAELEIKERVSEVVEPQTETESTIVEVFKEVVGVKGAISVEDNFFDLGGDSIKAIRIVSKLRERGLQADVRTIMQYRTPRKIGKNIDKVKLSRTTQDTLINPMGNESCLTPLVLEKEKHAIFDQINVFPLEQIENQYVASDAQAYYLCMQPSHLIFDQFVLDSILGEQDVIQALVQVIGENGILRSTYSKEAEQYTLYEHQLMRTYSPPYFDLREMSFSDKSVLFEALGDHHKWRSYFKVGTWMSQFAVLREADETYRIVFAIHHAIWDKMSSLVLEEQVQSVLDGKEEVTSILPYAHYIASLNHDLVDKQVQKVAHSFVKLLETYKKETKSNPISKLEASLIKLLNELHEKYDQIDIWDFLVQIARVIAHENGLFTERTKGIPMQIVQEGRNKYSTDYSQSLGLFVDFAPISIDHEADKQHRSISHHIHHLDQLKKKNNFSWQGVLGAHSNDLDSVLLINYLGVYEVDFERIKQAIANNLDVVAREITITLHDDHLSIIYPVFGNASSKIDQKLQEKVNAYSSSLATA